MATETAVRAAAPAVAERIQGEQPSRVRAIAAATVIGAAVAVVAYRLLRNVPANDDATNEDSE
jgi:hypothetical protein